MTDLERARALCAEAEMNKHLSGRHYDDICDGIRQLAQVAMTNEDNCKTLEERLKACEAWYAERLKQAQEIGEALEAERDTLKAENARLWEALEAAYRYIEEYRHGKARAVLFDALQLCNKTEALAKEQP